MKEYTPKKQAEEIIGKIFNEQHLDDKAKLIAISTKNIALFVADLMIENEPGIRQIKLIDDIEYEWLEYWTQVKQEIEKWQNQKK